MNTKSESADLNPEESAAASAPTGESTDKPADTSADTTVDAPTDTPVDATVDATADAPAEAPVDKVDKKDDATAAPEPKPEPTTDVESVEPEAAAKADAPEPASKTEVAVEATELKTKAVEVTMAETSAKTDTEDDASADAKTGDEEAAAEVTKAVTKEVTKAVEEDSRLTHKLKKGQRVEVKLIQAGDKDAFLDWGGPSEGSIAAAELKDDKGKLRVKEGESFTVIVKETGDTVVFTVGRGKGGDLLRMRELQTAHESKVPVSGRIRSTNKGGFEVELGGVRAFCPFSQIDTIYCEKPELHVGKEYPFMIITFERGGRNIVLSRRELIAADQKEQAVKTRESLELGAVLKGKVRRIQPYGAFIDIGGLDGLVHVSEISRAHIRNPKDVLSVGQEVDVKVVALDAMGTKKERVSLSMKALAPDPWEGAVDKWKVGSTTTGTVVRLTDFGAFVELAPGVDGLVHVSQIASERIGHPNEVLKPGQEVEVRILELDRESNRISLTMRPEGEEPPARSGGGGGGFRSRRPQRESGPMEYSSAPEEKTEKVDVSGMGYDDALAELKKKFEQ